MSLKPVHARDCPALDETYNKRVLSNGLTCVDIRQPHLHRGSVAVFFKTGSRYESPRDNGLSHFLEHMVFRGTEHHESAYALNLAIEQLGGTLFAATSPDATEYALTLPPQNLVSGIGLLAEIAARPIFNDIEIERRVVIEEIREDLDENGASIDIDFLSRKRLWPGHPLGQSVTGPIENARRFTAEDVRRHLTANYTAENAVVCLSGAFDAHEVSKAVETAFAALPTRGRPHDSICAVPSAAPILGRGPTVLHAHRPGSQTDVRLAFHAPSGTDPDWVGLGVLMGILDDGMSTRLHRRIFDELGLAYNVGADVERYADVGVLNIDAVASHASISNIAKEIATLAAELKNTVASDDEINKAKQRKTWCLESFLDDPHAMSAWYGEQALHWQPELLVNRMQRISAVTTADVRRIAARIFTRDNLHLTTVGVLDPAQQQQIAAIAEGFN
ncbi:MAG: pitrilysin family protein [Myxococcota bacterium]|nr:pitrilysin family protein [Myxococcota bacterium]